MITGFYKVAANGHSFAFGGHLENVQPGTAADVSYKSWEYILLLNCVQSAGYVADCSTVDEVIFVAPADAKLNVGRSLFSSKCIRRPSQKAFRCYMRLLPC